MTRSFVEIGGCVLHVARRGDPAKPVVVYANSLGTDFRIWDAVTAALDDRFSSFHYDMRGHGLSDTPRGPYTVSGLADDLVGALDAYGVGRFALVGLSVGGMIAQSVAAGHPDRVSRLVLCGTAARIGSAEAWNARIAAVTSEGLPAIVDSVMERWFTSAYRTRETAAMQGWRNMLARQPAEGYAATCAAIRDADLTAEAMSIRAPTLCVVGDHDLSTPPDLVRGTATLIPGARFKTITDAGHIPCVEQPAALARLIAGHLA